MTDSELASAKKKLGNHVFKIRESKNMTLADVSANCSLEETKISKIEHGRINITFGTLLELAKGLEISPAKLLEY